MSFTVAMQNRRATASFSSPYQVIDECYEYLIVMRFGEQDQYLSLSNAGASSGFEDSVTTLHSTDQVLTATLVSRGPLPEDSIYLIDPVTPDHLGPGVTHLAADGYLHLICGASVLRLTGAARLSPGAPVGATGPLSGFFGADGQTWHYDAAYLPWPEEHRPQNFLNTRQTFGGDMK